LQASPQILGVVPNVGRTCHAVVFVVYARSSWEIGDAAPSTAATRCPPATCAECDESPRASSSLMRYRTRELPGICLKEGFKGSYCEDDVKYTFSFARHVIPTLKIFLLMNFRVDEEPRYPTS
jgi:hypothetical protein